jgi:hypothetical protein
VGPRLCDQSGDLLHAGDPGLAAGVRRPFSNKTPFQIRLRDLAARSAPELCTKFAPREKREQGMPGARCTRGLVCKMHERKRTRAYRFSGGNPAFPAQWFDGLWRALPGDQDLFVAVAPLIMAEPPGWACFASAGLDANHEASGPHAFAVRSSPSSPKGFAGPGAVRLRAPGIAHGKPALRHPARQRCRVHRIPSRVRDDARPPLLPGKDGASW